MMVIKRDLITIKTGSVIGVGGGAFLRMGEAWSVCACVCVLTAGVETSSGKERKKLGQKPCPWPRLTNQM